MAKIPQIKRIASEDFPSESSWIASLLRPLNEFMEKVTAALSSELTVRDNLAGEVKTLTVTEVPFEWKYARKDKPVAVWVGASFNASNQAAPIPVISWESTASGGIRITALSGLSPAPSVSAPYSLTFIAISG